MPTPSDPTSAPSKQFSSDVNGNPRSLLSEQEASNGKFEALQDFLNNTLQVAGGRVCHPLKGDK